MSNLFIECAETEKLNAVLAKLERKYGAEYSYVPEVSDFSCRCSGPAQSCVWH